RILFETLKNRTSPHYRVEADLLRQVAARPLPEGSLKDSTAQRVLAEMAKQKLIRLSPRGWRLTPLGTWYIKSTSG
ncbi:MAG: hypothetical protein GWM98_21690, partial [Nitrospinaceae bacterium]|nr:hypothetical protein [Nitrospinaceae bacterium]NIR56594.1 hypothetical protein [Nitrospinaceae bacterium]NIS87056.1 hypothetical protein [Nitrospinaceae bacterium]NIT83900.1 hypothetical protein [Nitrospinaceae bacterium]NIU46103.1 hypothetical protein [Nitrospinaceae bacterium]